MSNNIMDTLKKYLETEDETSESVFNQLSLYIYSLDSNQHDLYLLSQILSPIEIGKLISYFSGDTIKVPTKREYRYNLLIAICYYLKVLKRWSWADIKESLNLPEINEGVINSISLGHKINQLQGKINEDISKILSQSSLEDFDNFLEKFKSMEGAND